MRVLIADDEPVTRRTLEVKLASWGHEVISATDGYEARTALTSEPPPALAILDWSMPGPSGVDLLAEIRATPALKDIYVILLTVRGTREEADYGLDAGADDYLIKPCDFAELRARISIGARLVEAQREQARLRAELDRLISGSLD